jgi:hypothetical protein
MSHRSLLLASLLLAAASSTALAQPSAAPAATGAPAPQTHAWEEVSHVNGQLVPVGESNSYLKKFRKTNISSNPVGWMIGFYGVSVSHAVSNHVAIRGDANYINPVGESESYTELGVGVPLYLRRTYQGAFIEPGFIVRTESNDYCDSSYGSCNDTDVTTGPQMLIGWHWTWDSGFNVAAAVGVGRNINHDDNDDSYDDEEIFGNGYFRVGYAF